jgi:uncharacterized SAM-dependent methyltransferase
MHLESTREQTVFIAATELEAQFVRHETIHSKSCHRFSDESIQGLLQDSYFEIEKTWKDGRGWYTATLAHLNEFRNQL